MSLIPVDAEYHYVQDTAPTTANAGDVWLDTSQDPPVAKIYADVGNGLEWLVDQSSDRIATNLDAPVSEAGQGVDWATKTPAFSPSGFESSPNTNILSVNGSGYLTLINVTGVGTADEVRVEIDGDVLFNDDITRFGGYNTPSGGHVQFNGSYRFDSTLTVGTGDELPNGGIQIGVGYVLD